MDNKPLIQPPTFMTGRASATIRPPSFVPGQDRQDKPIIPCEEWLKSNYYTGKLWGNFWRESTAYEFCELVDDPNVEEVILDGSIGWGKSFFARAYMLRFIYEITTRANPGQFFLGNPTSVVQIALMSVKKEKARKILFDQLRTMMDKIPYFQREARYNSQWETSRLLTEIKFDDIGLVVKPVVTNVGAVISDDMIGFALDEANFLPKVKNSKRALDAESSSRAGGGVWSAAREFIKKARTRIRSRFLKNGRCWGRVMILSSSIDDNDFTEERRRIADQRGDLGSKVRYVSKSLWEGKAQGTYSARRFHVDMGRRGIPPRILPEGEEAYGEVFEVPEDFRVDFEDDPVLATRELAGRRTAPKEVWLRDSASLEESWDRDRDEPGEPVQISGQLSIRRAALVSRESRRWEPRYFPELPRVVHIDLSSTGDRTGIAMGCTPGYTTIEIRDRQTGGIREVKIAKLHCDFALGISPPPGGRIDILEIEDFVFNLGAMGFDVVLATFDQYQSERSIQSFEDAGIRSLRLSVERPTPYLNLRRTIRKGALSMPYNAELERELTNLLEDSRSGKVDHPPRGSKDIADALAGICHAVNETKYLEKTIDTLGGLGPLPSVPIF